MKLSTWLEQEHGRAAAMASHFGVSEAAIHQWKASVPKKRILAVSAYTSNEVTVQEMLQGSESDPEPSSVAAVGVGA